MLILFEIDINGTTHYASMEGIAFDRWYAPHVIGMSPVQYRIAKIYGGYIAPSWGSIELSQELFSAPGDWPPPAQIGITVKVGETTFLTELEGTGYLNGFTRESVSYDIYTTSYDVDALEQAPDFPETSPPTYDNNRVYPRAFGMVTHVNPLRIGLDTEQKYHKGDIAGVVGTDWHVYDDGVNIDSNVTDNGDGTFSLSATPVGEVTLSGQGTYATLTDVFSWGATKLGLTLDVTNARSPSPNVGFWLDSQRKVIDLLSDVAAFFTHFFYIKSGTLYLVDMAADLGATSITEFEYMPSQYTQDQPVKSLSATWPTAVAVTDSTGKHVKRDQDSLVVMSGLGFGEEWQVAPFTSNRNDINSALNSILAYLNKRRARLKMPYTKSAPPFGSTKTWTDTSHIVDTTMSMKVRNVQIDFVNEEMVIDGEGDIS